MDITNYLLVAFIKSNIIYDTHNRLKYISKIIMNFPCTWPSSSTNTKLIVINHTWHTCVTCKQSSDQDPWLTLIGREMFEFIRFDPNLAIALPPQ